MLDIVFSIPIHHRLEVVVDQILNFHHFNPNCGIVLHFSIGFDYANSLISKEEFSTIVDSIGNVFINHISVRTGYADIIQAHLCNYEYVRKCVDFQFFAMCASNELFIKTGLFSHLNKYDCGVMQDVLIFSKWPDGEFAQNDAILHKYVLEKKIDKILYTYPEGQFYRRELFDTIYKEIISFYDYRDMDKAYPREEVYFPTVLGYLNKENLLRVSDTFNYSAYHLTHLWDVTRWEIEKIRRSKNNLYSIKRVDRNINDNIRAYLRDKFEYKKIETDYFSPLKIKLHSYSLLQTDWLDIKKYITSIFNNMPAILKRIGLNL